jgi:hypothetical protein
MLSGFYLDCIQIRKRAANYFDSSNPIGVTKGVVYEKKLGKSTVEDAKTMTEFNPDKSWTAVM